MPQSYPEALHPHARFIEDDFDMTRFSSLQQRRSLAEYDEILDSLSPNGLSVHLAADSVAEGQAVMDAVRARARQ